MISSVSYKIKTLILTRKKAEKTCSKISPPFINKYQDIPPKERQNTEIYYEKYIQPLFLSKKHDMSHIVTTTNKFESNLNDMPCIMLANILPHL